MTASILQVVTDTDRRGAQVFALDLDAALTRRGRVVRTVALAPGRVGGLDVAALGRRPLAVGTLRALRREARAAAVVVAHGSTTLPACAVATLGLRTPFVYRQISDSRFWASTPARRLRVRWGLRRAARVVALWDGAAQVLAVDFGVRNERLRVVANGVPPERFPPVDRASVAAARAALGLDPGRITLCYLGALVAEKGVDVAVDALGALDDAQLLVAGDGSERSALEARAATVAPGRAVFAGSLDDPNAALAAADVLVLPSRGGDSVPAVLIEAAFAGVPVVATPVGGIAEIVVDGVTGALVPVGSVEGLAGAVRRVVEDPAHYRALVAAAREHCAQRFAMDVVAREWDEVLAAVSAGAPRSG